MTQPNQIARHSSAEGRPAQYFERACYATALAAFGRESAVDIARQHWPDDNSTPKLITRTAVNPASRGTAAWAGSLAADATTDFVTSLAPASAFAHLCVAGMKVDLAGLDSIWMWALPQHVPNDAETED